jgi:glycosyltransferase involved in cell wall biosynthesis
MNDLPFVSIVIPVRNEADAIRATLEACASQDYPGELEIIVADGMSDDGTRQTVEAAADGGLRVRLVDNPARSAPGGLNQAIRAAGGTIIVRCDAHAVLPPGYVSRAVAQLEATRAANVGGVQRAVGDGTVQRAIAMAMTSPIGVGDARYRYGGNPGPTDTVYLGNFQRDAIEAVGLFNEKMVRNQDYELNYRIRAAGGTVWFDPELVVDYEPRRTLGGLARQYFDYGVGKRRMLRLHPGSLRWRQLAAPGLVLGLAGSGISGLLGAGTAAAIVPLLYGTALAAGVVYETVRQPGKAVLVFPAAVVTMHLAWGAGFLAESLGMAPQADAR